MPTNSNLPAREPPGSWWPARAVPASAIYFGPVILFYAAFLVLPYAFLLRLSVFRYSSMRLYVADVTSANYRSVLLDPYYQALLARTVAMGVGVTVMTLLLGYPLALMIARASPRTRSLLLAVTLSPLLINLVVRTYAWLVLLGDKGLVNTWLGALGLIGRPLPLSGNLFAVTVGLVHIGLPLMVLSLVGVLERIDPHARGSGAEPGGAAGPGAAPGDAAAVPAWDQRGVSAGVRLHHQRLRHAGGAGRQPGRDVEHGDL